MVRPVTDDDIGLKVLREPLIEAANDIVDIVAIHGIGAHPDEGWSKNVGTVASPQWVNWLVAEDMLPAVAPYARIMRYGYQSQWFGEGAIRQRVTTVARRLLLALRRKRQDHPSRPLIFIAHCFGGLVVLKALLDARHDEGEWPGMFASTTGLVFFGTPFRGAGGLSQVEMLAAAQQEYQEEEVQLDVLQILEPGNEFLQELVDQFGKTYRQAHEVQVACFYELKPSNVGAIVGKMDRRRFVVSESSGCLDMFGVISKFSRSRTHFNMNKFGKPTEEDFETVRDVVKEMIEAAHKSGQDAIYQVESVLDSIAQKRGGRWDWRESVVDLLKLLGLDSHLSARERLAKKLHVQVGSNGTALQNNAIRKAVIKELVVENGKISSMILGLDAIGQSGRQVPNPGDKCYACGERGHWAFKCRNRCYACREIGHWAEECPEKCYNCGDVGHWAAACLRK